MRITQGYISKSISDFPFHQIYTLDDYNSVGLPCVFFGMYRFEDWILFSNHQGYKSIFWTGHDAMTFDWEHLAIGNNHFTAHHKVADFIRSKGYDCELVNPSSFLNEFFAEKLGAGIYAYCPTSAKEYHGSKILDELKAAGYSINIGDGYVSQKDWKHVRNAFYNDIFIGLCLSSFAGGGTSIIEMGLRGVNVVTNVFKLPHCLSWVDNGDVEQSAQYIAALIDIERMKIGERNELLARKVWDALDHEFKWLEI